MRPQSGEQGPQNTVVMVRVRVRRSLHAMVVHLGPKTRLGPQAQRTAFGPVHYVQRPGKAE